MTTVNDPAGGWTEFEWTAALPWDAYLASVKDKRDLWLANSERAAVNKDSAARLAALPARRRVLVIVEDWCGDALRSAPLLAKAFVISPMIEARYLPSDAHPETLARYLTHGGRAIPMALVQDETGRFLGAWGPRPAPLQAMFRKRRREIGPPTKETMAEFYTPIMRWYGEDHGETILDEILMLLERGGTPR
jgi:hypothetical protein